MNFAAWVGVVAEEAAGGAALSKKGRKSGTNIEYCLFNIGGILSFED